MMGREGSPRAASRALRLLRAWPFAGLALSAGLLIAWHSVWLPRVHVVDSRWLASHTDDERCAEIAKVVPIWGWDHDMTLDVGSCGPEWVGTILGEAHRPEDLDSRDGHLGTALRLLTGQSIGDSDVDGWKRWYAANRGKSQKDWYRDAFAAEGVMVPLKLEAEDACRLLAWMGERHEHGPAGYCAYRLLEGQDAMMTISIHGPARPLSPLEAHGLERFEAFWSGHHLLTLSPIIAEPASQERPPIAFWLLAIVSAYGLGRRRRMASS